jgi:hypothetical protein
MAARPTSKNAVKHELSRFGSLQMTETVTVPLHVRLLIALIALCLFSGASHTSSVAYARTVDQVTLKGVEAHRMGVYEALALLTMRSFDQRDYVTAGALARILELTWDRSESALSKSSLGTYREIDQAMDEFLKPLELYARRLLIDANQMSLPPEAASSEQSPSKRPHEKFFAATTRPPDSVKVHEAFNAYLKILSTAD